MCWLFMAISHLHGGTHGVEEVDDDKGDDGEPLLPRETAHGYVLSPGGLWNLKQSFRIFIVEICPWSMFFVRIWNSEFETACGYVLHHVFFSTGVWNKCLFSLAEHLVYENGKKEPVFTSHGSPVVWNLCIACLTLYFELCNFSITQPWHSFNLKAKCQYT